MRIPRFIRHHLTLLQLEQYELGRYLRVAIARYLPFKTPRQEAIWTVKMRIIALIATLLAIGMGLAGYAGYDAYGTLVALALSYVLMPFLLGIATAITWPVDRISKGLIIRKAQKKSPRFQT